MTWNSHTGLFSAIAGSRYSYVPIDCHDISKNDLWNTLRASNLEDVHAVIYLDEVAARWLEDMLLRLIDQHPHIWIASAIGVLQHMRGDVVQFVQVLHQL